jgi:hypothetical protein
MDIHVVAHSFGHQFWGPCEYVEKPQLLNFNMLPP